MTALRRDQIEKYIDERVKILLDRINVQKDDLIFVSRALRNESTGRGVFDHTIHVGSAEHISNTAYWDGGEAFSRKGVDLFFYLKGRLLLQTTTVWTIWDTYKTKGIFSERFQMYCSYSLIQDDVV